MFWALENSDPYLALSFDRLHASHLGLFKSHIWSTLKVQITAAGRAEIERVEDTYLSYWMHLKFVIYKGFHIPMVEWTCYLCFWHHVHDIL